MGSMSEWAENEVRIACKKENPNWGGESFDYGCGCYQSALKAYQSICADGHSGMSFGFTKNILIRLLNELPLTKIEDTPDTWSDISWIDEESGEQCYQCNRMYGLFKHVSKDGSVIYTDINRYYCVDVSTGSTYSGGGVSKLLDKLYPIAMPYYPPTNKFKVYTDEFIAEGFLKDNEDYNTRAVLYLITPNGEKVGLNKYYADTEHGLAEISEEEYNQRLAYRKTA